MKNKFGQIWVETALYLLIGIALIGMFLAFATPEIQRQKDRIVFEASLDAMIDIDNSILEIKRMGTGNQRTVKLLIKMGTLKIDAENDEIILFLDGSRYAASEIGKQYDVPVDVPGTDLVVVTKKSADKYDVIITRSFDEKIFNITYNGEDELKELNMAPTPYVLVLENKGRASAEAPLNINIREISS